MCGSNLLGFGSRLKAEHIVSFIRCHAAEPRGELRLVFARASELGSRQPSPASIKIRFHQDRALGIRRAQARRATEAARFRSVTTTLGLQNRPLRHRPSMRPLSWSSTISSATVRTPDFCPGDLRLLPKGPVVTTHGRNRQAETMPKDEKQEGCKGDEDWHRRSAELFKKANGSLTVRRRAVVSQSLSTARRIHCDRR